VIGLKVWVWVMVFNTTFNNISAISWQSILMVEETRIVYTTEDDNDRHIT
jgi:hypothetical protein